MIPNGVKQHPVFTNYYITKNGEVWSNPRSKSKGGWLKSRIGRGNYPIVQLCANGKVVCRRVSTLILETFVGNRPIGMECCHNNGVRADNRLENLRWDTRSNNAKDAVRHKTHRSANQYGERNLNSKLTEQDIRTMIYIHRTDLFSKKEIAGIYKVSRSCIQNIFNGKTWGCMWKGN